MKKLYLESDTSTYSFLVVMKIFCYYFKLTNVWQSFSFILLKISFIRKEAFKISNMLNTNALSTKRRIHKPLKLNKLKRIHH